MLGSLETFFIHHNIEATLSSRTETVAIHESWRQTFGSDPSTPLAWENLPSYRFTLRSGAAEEGFQYIRPTARDFVVICSRESVTYGCRCSLIMPHLVLWRQLAEDNPSLYDLYICSSTFEWTLVLTHEDTSMPNTGPFLAYKSVVTKSDFFD